MYLYYNYPISGHPSPKIQDLGDISVVEVTISERELEEILSDVESMNLKRMERFLSNFLLEREIRILRALAMTYVKKGQPEYADISDETKGWMNKNKIHLSSGVSRKVIYKRSGVMERLTKLALIKKTNAGIWGRNKEQYRLNTSNHFIHAYAMAVLDSIKRPS